MSYNDLRRETMTTETKTAAERYIARIKNTGKKQYAKSLLAHLRTPEGNWDNIPGYKQHGIHLMGAQSVELELREILKGAK